MTMQEVNEQIAVLKGWAYEKGHTSSFIRKGIAQYYDKEWLRPDRIWCKNSPDFCGEWEHAGPLLEELFGKREIDAEVALQDILIIQDELGCKLTEAISRTYLPWKTEESQHDPSK